MDHPHRISALALATSCCFATAGAQDASDPASVRRHAHALVEAEAGLAAFGPGFKADLQRGGVRFVPALGRAAPRALPLHLVTVSVRRGREVLWTDAAGGEAPIAERTTARYERSPVLTERWQVRADGLELSYVFAEPLPGDGDLVVQLAVDSELDALPTAEGGFRFRAPGLGGVRVGAATGIDAAGRTTRGSQRLAGGRLEISLPGAFVDAASYPLVLDPLIGPEVAIGSQTGDDRAADVAYDLSNDCWLVCWQEEFSALDADIRAQRVTPKGTPSGSLLPLTSGPEFSMHPTVANAARTDRFLVVWQEGPTVFGPFDLVGANVAASSTGSFTVGGIASSPANEGRPDAASGANDAARVVWREDGVGIVGSVVSCAPPGVAGNPPRPSTPVVLGPASATGVAISQGGGGAGRHVVVWSGPGGTEAVGVDAAMSPVGDVLRVTAAAGAGEADVDGDGTDFLVVWQQLESPSGPRRDVLGHKVAFAAATSTATLVLSGSPVPIAADPGRDERTPAVGLLGPKVLVAWSEEPAPSVPLTYGVAARALSPVDCAECGPEWTLGSGGPGYDHDPRIGTMRAAGSSADEAFVVFSSASSGPPFTSEVMGQAFAALGSGGTVSAPSPACGNGGSMQANGPVAIGNAGFAYDLTGAEPGASLAAFVLNVPSPPIGCGGCVITSPLVVQGVPVSAGAATFPLPIRCELDWLGATLETQWWIVGTASPCSLAPRVSFSNRLLSTIGL